MEETRRILACREDITVLIIFAEIPIKEYADTWLALSNNKREHRDFLQLCNYYGSNSIKVVIDITEEKSKEEAKEHYIRFLKSWSCEIESVSIEKAVKYSIPEYELNEDDETEIIIVSY